MNDLAPVTVIPTLYARTHVCIIYCPLCDAHPHTCDCEATA